MSYKQTDISNTSILAKSHSLDGNGITIVSYGK